MASRPVRPDGPAARQAAVGQPAVGEPAVRESAVRGRGVRVAYGEHVALAPSDFSVAPGTITAVVGPNGSGKSTLLSAIAGLLPLSGGELAVLGERPGAKPLATRLAYVLQATPAAAHLPVTVREVVTMGRFALRGHFRRLTSEDRRIVADAMEQLEVTDLADRHLLELSSGQRQRVLVAQGMAQQAELLLLDEPLTGLDLASARRISDALAGLRSAGGTVLLATHDLGDAERCDEVMLVAGRIVALGAPDDVITTTNLRAAYGGRLGPTEADSRAPSWRHDHTVGHH